MTRLRCTVARTPRTAAVFLLGLPVALGACGEPTPPTESVALVLVDSLRRDHLSLYGHDLETSPDIDALADEGLVLELCIAPSSNSRPALESILAGRLRTGFGSAESDEPRPLVLPKTLRDAGFATAWFSNADYDLGPIPGAFDHAAGTPADATDALVGQSLAWIAKQERPFLLVLHLTEPRLPFAADPSVRGRFTGGLGSSLTLPVEDPPTGPDVSAVDRAFVSAAYDEEVAQVMEPVARFVAALQSGPWAEPGCLVIVTANHGIELHDRGGVGSGRSLHPEQLWVPCVMWGGEVWPRRLAVPTTTLDLVPTLCEALGVEPPAGSDGVSLWGLVTAHATQAPDLRPIVSFGVHEGQESWSALRWPWKLVRHAADRRATLYDRSKDADERTDVAAEYPEEMAELLAELEARLGG